MFQNMNIFEATHDKLANESAFNSNFSFNKYIIKFYQYYVFYYDPQHVFFILLSVRVMLTVYVLL